MQGMAPWHRVVFPERIQVLELDEQQKLGLGQKALFGAGNAHRKGKYLYMGRIIKSQSLSLFLMLLQWSEIVVECPGLILCVLQ